MTWMYQDIGGGIKRLLFVLGKVASDIACCCTAPSRCCLSGCGPPTGMPQTIEFSPGAGWTNDIRFNGADFCKCGTGPTVDDPRNGIFNQVRILSQLTDAPTSGCADIDSFGDGFPCVWRYHEDNVCHYTNNFLESCKDPANPSTWSCLGVSLDLDIQVRLITPPAEPVTDYCYLECLASMTGVCTDGPKCHKWKWVPYPVVGWWSNESCFFTLVISPDECGAGDLQWQDPINPGLFYKQIDRCTTCYTGMSAIPGDLAEYHKITIYG